MQLTSLQSNIHSEFGYIQYLGCKLAFYVQIMPENDRKSEKNCNFFRRNRIEVLQFWSDSAKILYIVSLRVIQNSGCVFLNYFLSFYGASKVKNGHFAGFWGFFTSSSVRKI